MQKYLNEVLSAINVPSMKIKIVYLYRKISGWSIMDSIVANEIMNPNLVTQLLYRSGSLSVNSVQGTQENEDYARSYIQEMLKKGTPFILHKVGLIISSSKPHLACSADNFVGVGSTDDISVTAENKCPYAARDILRIHIMYALIILIFPLSCFLYQRQKSAELHCSAAFVLRGILLGAHSSYTH